MTLMKGDNVVQVENAKEKIMHILQDNSVSFKLFKSYITAT